MNRRAFLCGTISATLAIPRTAEARQAGKVYRIAWLGTLTLPSEGDAVTFFRKAFVNQLEELGWNEGRDFLMQYRLAPPGDPERLAALARELVRLNVDLIVVTSTPAALAAAAATTTIPLVMAGIASPGERGLIASQARPGGNVTGLTSSTGVEFNAKRLQILKEAAPRISRVAVLRNGTFPLPEEQAANLLRYLQSVGNGMGVEVLPFVEARSLEELPEALVRIVRERADAVVVNPTGLNLRGRRRIVDFTLAQRLPAMFGARSFVEAGGLMSYWTNWSDLIRRAAPFADRILKGANPADLPVEDPTKFDLLINLKTARALGLTIPPSLLLRADQVIE